MKRSLWKATFSANFIPSFPCPACRSGALKKNKKEDFITRCARDSQFHEYEENPSNYPSRFSLFLKCDKCSDYVVIVGTSTDVPEEMHDGSLEWFEYCAPESMWPAPPIISAEQVPKEVRDELFKSFGFFWSDFDACASRVRTSVERLMDHFNIAATAVAVRNGGVRYRKRLDLSSRIDKFASKVSRRGYRDILHALRVVGNLGTHGHGRIKRAEMLDAYKLYEFALERIFEKKDESIEEIAKRLRKLK